MENSQGSPMLDHAIVTDIFKKACQDYGIPHTQLALSLDFDDGGVGGTAYPSEKKISFSYSKTCSRNMVTFGLYHEIGHCLDEELLKFEKRRPLRFTYTLGGAIASSLMLTTLGCNMIDHIVSRYPTLQRYPSLIPATYAIAFLSSIGMSAYLAFIFSRSQTCYFEHRANLAACKKLLKSNTIEPIVEFLACMKFYARKNIRTHFNHPLASDEYEQVKHFLEGNGYSVQLIESKTKNELNVTVFEGNASIAGCTLRWK